MREGKFHIGDRIRLTSPHNPDDPNNGVEGIVVAYEEDVFDDLLPVIKICDGFDWDDEDADEEVRQVDWLTDDWWMFVESSKECYCSSLL